MIDAATRRNFCHPEQGANPGAARSDAEAFR